MRILLISTDKVEAARLQQQLRQSASQRYALQVESEIATTRSLLQDNDFDVILVDMHKGREDIATLATVLNRSVGARVLALVPAQHQEIGQRALKLGAEHYCIKEQLAADLLLCIAHYCRTSRRHNELGGDPARHERQQRPFEQRLAARKAWKDAAKGQEMEQPLSSRDNERFSQLARRFGDALELALERHVYKVDFDISGALRNLAGALCELRAQPRDMVEIFTASLESKRHKVNELRYKGYTEEGRLLLIETMGYLVGYYRQEALAGNDNAHSTQAG